MSKYLRELPTKNAHSDRESRAPLKPIDFSLKLALLEIEPDQFVSPECVALIEEFSQ